MGGGGQKEERSTGTCTNVGTGTCCSSYVELVRTLSDLSSNLHGIRLF